MTIEYLDTAAASAPGRGYKQRLLTVLNLSSELTVLDVGCGPGTDLPAMADLAGRVIGVDRDPVMLAEARRRTADRPDISVREGDAHSLPLAEGSVDRARMDRVIQHLADPAEALAELRRVLRPGGLVALADNDWDTLVIDSTDTQMSRAYTTFVATQVVRNGTIGRQLARLAEATPGLTVRSVEAIPVVFRDYAAAEQLLGFSRVAERGIAAGALDETAARAWLAGLATGPFLAALTFFVVTASA